MERQETFLFFGSANTEKQLKTDTGIYSSVWCPYEGWAGGKEQSSHKQCIATVYSFQGKRGT